LYPDEEIKVGPVEIEMQDKTDVAGEKTKQELIVEQQEYFDKKDRELEA